MKKMLPVVALLAILLLASCTAGHNISEDTAGTEGKVAGFWLGLWQGIISPIAFLISLFNNNVSVYEVHNNGGWYNFGFVFGCSIIFGGGGKASSRRKHRGESRQL